MIKGIRWYFVVLFLAASLWIASSLNNNHRQRRQLRNALYLRQLRNSRYLPPIPIYFPPYVKERPQPSSQESKSTESPWIPMKSSSTEEVSNQNKYVPPIPPPPMIVTRKPLRNTFDVPLTKTIQVSQTKPKIQTTGYIRKNLVKIYATRTTTVTPKQKNSGSLAESTVQTFLDFTPMNERWKPHVFTTPSYPILMPNHDDFGEILGSKVDKHLNYTGMKYGKINSVVKSLPQNGAALKVLRNESNFVMRFTPEDVKYASVEVKTENIDTPFYVDRPEVKHLNGANEEHRTLFDGFDESQKVSNLRNEGNIPYQGHKRTMKKVPTVIYNTPKGSPFKEVHKDRKTVFDDFSNAENPRTNVKNKNTVPFQSQSSLISDPYNAELFNFGTRAKQKVPNQKERKVINQYHNENAKNVETTLHNSNDDDRNFFSEPVNTYDISSDDQIKSNFPYQGHATVIKKPEFSANYGNRFKEKSNHPNIRQQTRPPSPKPTTNTKVTRNNEKLNQPKVNGDLFKASPQDISANYEENTPYINKKDINPTNRPFNNSDIYKYSPVLNPNQNNVTHIKDAITVEKAPILSGVEYEKSILPNTPKVKNKVKASNVKNNQEFNLHQSSPKPPRIVSISQEDASVSPQNKKNRLRTEYNVPQRPAFDRVSKLKEAELKNPPEYLQFGDEDFLKPVIPVHFDKETDPAKTLSAFTFPVRQKPDSPNKHDSIVYKDSERLPNIPESVTTRKTASKVEYYENSKFDDKKPSDSIDDGIYFQPVFPDTLLSNHHDLSRPLFENYNNDDQAPLQISETTKEHASKANSAFSKPGKENLNTSPYDTSREKQKINKDAIVTKSTNYSPEDTRRNTIKDLPKVVPEIITPPPVITVKYDPSEPDDILSKRGSVTKVNRTENYVIQRKPSLLPESANRPRKPKITISTGMLAGILIAALVFLGFLTGSMVYAFHQWKFGRRNRKEKKKKTRTAGFPPEYLDENFAATKPRRSKPRGSRQHFDDRGSHSRTTVYLFKNRQVQNVQ